MAKYRGLAPWALGVAVLAHACASATGLTENEDEASTASSARSLTVLSPGTEGNVIGMLRLQDGDLVISSESGGVRYAFQAPNGSRGAALTLDELKAQAPELYDTVRSATAAATPIVDARLDPREPAPRAGELPLK